MPIESVSIAKPSRFQPVAQLAQLPESPALQCLVGRRLGTS